MARVAELVDANPRVGRWGTWTRQVFSTVQVRILALATKHKEAEMTTIPLEYLLILAIWSVGGIFFAAHLFDKKSARSIKELSSSKLEIGLILVMSGPVFTLGVLAAWVGDKALLFVGRFINWLVD